MVKMNKRTLLFLSLTLLSCLKNEVKQYDDGNDPAVDGNTIFWTLPA